MNNAPRRSDVEYSRGNAADPGAARGAGAVLGLLSALVVAGAAALVAATLAPVIQVGVGGHTVAALDRTGWDRHGLALPVLATLALVLLPLALRGSAAAFAIAGCGVGAIVIAAAIDLPDLGGAGAVGAQLAEGTTKAGAGLYLEALGGVLLLAGGGLLAMARQGG